jgi:hypothetical protein
MRGIFMAPVMDEPTEPEISTRRGLLGAVARAVARPVREASDVLGTGGLPGLLTPDDPYGNMADGVALPGATARAARRPACSPQRAASFEELLALAHAQGLTQRDDELRGLAKRSLRMTLVEPAHADAWILTSNDWIVSGEEVLLALINLKAATIHDCALPGAGWLALFVEADNGPVGLEIRHGHGVVLELPAAISDAAEPVTLSPELVLPRRWHEAVQAMRLDNTEADAYDRLRTQMQLLQGTEDDGDGGPDIAFHRLLGYPNETTGSMPSDCARALGDSYGADRLGFDVEDPGLPSHEWRLLMQISAGEQRRTYLWIRWTDLNAGEFGKLFAFVR